MGGKNEMPAGIEQRAQFSQPARERAFWHVGKEGQHEDDVVGPPKIKIFGKVCRQCRIDAQFITEEIDCLRVNVTGSGRTIGEDVLEMAGDAAKAGSKFQNTQFCPRLVTTDLLENFLQTQSRVGGVVVVMFDGVGLRKTGQFAKKAVDEIVWVNRRYDVQLGGIGLLRS